MRIALGVEYDGGAFCGWQMQNGVRTVQGCVEQALSKVADHEVRVICAGRTDTGVHGLGQIIHFDTEATRSMRSWVLGGNANLPPDVSLLWAAMVADEFHARFSARSRRYRYVILNRWVRPGLQRGRVSWVHAPLDVEAMRSATQYLIGEHDFSSYRALACQAKSPVRRVYSLKVERAGEYIYLDMHANAFLHHMVRNIAGVLIAIGKGERSPEWAREVLELRDRTQGGITAPPDGLYFIHVEYPERFMLPEQIRLPQF
ncbi:MAG: tRNA pseudouridine(38-40) synthase TruA [Acidihalobacter sp.]